MPLIRRADHDTRARNAIVLDLGDVRTQMDAMIDEARRSATRLIDDAKRERDRLVATASAEGRAAGHAEGLALGRKEGIEKGRHEVIDAARAQLAQVQASWQEAIGQFEESRRSLLEDSREDVVRLAAAIASRVTKRVVELNPDVVTAQVAEAISLVTKDHRLVVMVHPDDLPIVELAWPTLIDRFAGSSDCVLTTSDTIARGSCMVRKGEGGRGEIDASIQTQLDRIVRALLPGEPPLQAPPPSGPGHGAAAPSGPTGAGGEGT